MFIVCESLPTIDKVRMSTTRALKLLDRFLCSGMPWHRLLPPRSFQALRISFFACVHFVNLARRLLHRSTATLECTHTTKLRLR